MERIITALIYVFGGAWLVNRVLESSTRAQDETSRVLLDAMTRIGSLAGDLAHDRTPSAYEAPQPANDGPQAELFDPGVRIADDPYAPGLDPTDGIVPEQAASPFSPEYHEGNVASVPAGFGTGLLAAMRNGQLTGRPIPNMDGEDVELGWTSPQRLDGLDVDDA